MLSPQLLANVGFSGVQSLSMSLKQPSIFRIRKLLAGSPGFTICIDGMVFEGRSTPFAPSKDRPVVVPDTVNPSSAAAKSPLSCPPARESRGG